MHNFFNFVTHFLILFIIFFEVCLSIPARVVVDLAGRSRGPGHFEIKIQNLKSKTELTFAAHPLDN